MNEIITFDTVITPTSQIVPNLQPVVANLGYRLAIIVAGPEAEELKAGRPLAGGDGRFFDALLASRSILRGACLIASVFNRKIEDEDALEWSSPEMQESLQTLAHDLDLFQPNLCLLIGSVPLRAAKGLEEVIKRNRLSMEPPSVANWRGSLFLGEQYPFVGRKCMATYDPSTAIKDYAVVPLVRMDLARARTESEKPELVIPHREFKIANRTADEVCEDLATYQRAGKRVSVDIEGGVYGISCISFSNDPYSGFIVPFEGGTTGSYYEHIEDEARVWLAVKAILEDPAVPKVLQNQLYVNFVLSYRYGVFIRNVSRDTMLMHWELYSELKKSLGLQCSIYTRQPFYKSDRKANNWDRFYRYCCLDSAVTLEIADRLDSTLKGAALLHSTFNHKMLRPVLHMEVTGIRYDVEKAKAKYDIVMNRIGELQHDIDGRNGGALVVGSMADILCLFITNFVKVRDQKYIQTFDDVLPACRKADLENCEFALSVVNSITWPPTKGQLGLLSAAFKVGINPDSSKQLQLLLYAKKGLPVQHKKNTYGVQTATTNYEALLKLRKVAPTDPDLPAIIEITTLLTLSSMLKITADRDGRIRCSYNVVGTESGRFTCYKSPTGSGYNLTTIPDANPNWPVGHPLQPGMRDLFLADDGYDMFQCDLSGADAWTVAAHAARLGDHRMLADLRAGIKVAKVMVLMFINGPQFINGMTEDELLVATKTVAKDNPLYFGAKCCQHGSNYGMGKVLMASTILIQSEGKVIISAADCEKMQRMYFNRYPGVLSWHRWVQNELKTTGRMTSASGHTRIFFGRRDDQATFKAALANEPQENTTYATNVAMLNLWLDPENRRPDGSLIIQPLHQVHDALVGQWPSNLRDWAIPKVRSWFNNPITIAGRSITIPFEGRWGKSWGELEGEV